MKLNRKFLAVLLTLCMVLGLAAPAAAADLTASYGEASYYDIAVTNYSRMLLFQNGVVPAANASKLYGLIDAAGTAVVPFQYTDIASLGGGLYKVTKDTGSYASNWGIIDSTGKEMLPITGCSISVQNDTICVSDYSVYPYSYTYYTLTMAPSTEAAYRGGSGSASPLDGYDWSWRSGDYYVASKDNQYYVLDSSYKAVIPAQSSYINIISAGGTTVFVSGSKVFGASGSELSFSGSYDRIEQDYRGSAILKVSKDGQQGAIDFTGKVLVPLGSYTEVCGLNQQGYIAAVNYEGYGEDESGYTSQIFKDGTLVKTLNGTRVATEAYYRDMIFTLEGKATWGVMDINGNVLLSDNYTSIESDGNGNLLAGATEAGTWNTTYGLYSYDGKQYFADGYSQISYLKDNKYKLCRNGLYGVSTLDGTAVIPLRYQDMRIHTLNFVELYDGTYHSVVDLSNQVIVPASKSAIELFHSPGSSLGYELDLFNSCAVQYDGYTENVLPFCYQLDDGSYATVYADFQSGTVQSSLAARASNINADGMFAYQAANGLYGLGSTKGDTAPAAPSAPAADEKPAQTPAISFIDVSPTAYYATAVAWAVENTITIGATSTSFEPNTECTNAQILTFLWRAYGRPEPSIENPFSNAIPADYETAAVWAFEKGMVSGTTFDTKKPCTRAMVVTYLWQAAGKPESSVSVDFPDVSASADYAPAVAWAMEMKITEGNPDGSFAPDTVCSRGQIVTFLYRALVQN